MRGGLQRRGRAGRKAVSDDLPSGRVEDIETVSDLRQQAGWQRLGQDRDEPHHCQDEQPSDEKATGRSNIGAAQR